MNKKKEVVLNSVAEFLGIWALRGEASLSLKTKDGVTTIAFTHSLSGHPEDPLHPPPSPVGTHAKRRPRRRHRRGPARRERDRQRAAGHQAAQAGAPPTPQSQAASPAAPSTPEHLRGLRMSAMDTPSILHTKEKEVREEQEDPPEPPPTCASPLTSSTSAQEAQQEELRQVFDFLKSVEEKRQEERKADRRKFEEFVNSYSSSCDKREAD